MSNSFLDAIQNELSGQSLSALAGAIGAPQGQTQAAVAAALPVLLGALTRNASQPQGAQALANALEQDHSTPLASHANNLGGIGGLLQAAMGMAAAPQQSRALDGMGILRHMLGANQQAAAQSIAAQSGLSMDLVSKLLPALAPIVMSSLGTVKQNNGLDAGGLSDFLQSETKSMTQSNPGMFDALIDPAHDGVGTDDLVRMGMMLQQSGILGKLFG